MNSKYYKKLEAAGHVLYRDEDGSVDAWKLDYDYHNGPGCVNCHQSWCEHCEDTIQPCIGREEFERRARQHRYEHYLVLKEEFE